MRHVSAFAFRHAPLRMRQICRAGLMPDAASFRVDYRRFCRAAALIFR